MSEKLLPELRLQARAILAEEYKRSGYGWAADDAMSEIPSPFCELAIRAVERAIEQNTREAMHCQNGHGDVCLASQRDGVICAGGECDIDSGVRQNTRAGGEGSPSNCRNRLAAEGKPYPRSGCAHCKTGGLTGCPYEKSVHTKPAAGSGESGITLERDHLESIMQMLYSASNGRQNIFASTADELRDMIAAVPPCRLAVR